MQQEFKLWDKPRQEEVRVTARSTKDPEEWEAKCPRCPDKGYHLGINVRKEVYHCLRDRCNWSGHLAKDSPRPTMKLIPPKKVNPEVYKKMEARVKQYHESLGRESSRKFRDFLLEERGINQEIIDRYRLGYVKCHPEYRNTGERLTVPITKDGRVVNIRFHSFGSGQKIKDFPYTSNLPDAMALFPEDQLRSEVIWLVEGEPDCLRALSEGLPAATVTSGAGTWKGEFTRFFRDKTLYIVYDCDEAGRRGALTIANKLLPVVKKVKRLDLGLKDGQDLTDYLMIHPLEKLIQEVNIAQSDARSSKTKFSPRRYTEQIRKQYKLKAQRSPGYKRQPLRFWFYDEKSGLWSDDATSRLDNVLRELILGEDDFKIYAVSEVLADLVALSYKDDEEMQEPRPSLIPFKNVIYDLDTGEKLKYSPEFFFTHKLAVDLDERYQECPTIDRIFSQLVQEEDVVSLYEILAYCFYRSYPYPKAFILHGGGSNGKTAYINMLVEVLGGDNVSLVGLDDLTESRFALCEFEGKLANFSSETEEATIRKTTQFKRLTGNDLIRGDRKFQKQIHFRNHAKLIFATNQVPLTADPTVAFYRRMFLIGFPFRFEDGDKTTILNIHKTIPGYEYQGLAYKCLGFLRDLKERQFLFERHMGTREVAEQYTIESNPLKTFLDKFTKNVRGESIAKKDFRPRFLDYLSKKGKRPWTDRKVKGEMALLGHGDKREGTQSGDVFTTQHVWEDLEWVDREW